MVPDSWSERRLEEVARLRRGISWSKDEEVEPPEGEPVLSIPNIQPDGLDLSVLRHIQIDSERAAKYRAEPGWLIMVASNGNPDRIGDCVPVPADRSLLFASFLLGLKPEDSVVTPSFLRWAVQGPILQRQIRGEVQGSTGLQNLSLRTISSYRIPVPPLPEQRKIAAILSSVDDAIAATWRVIEQTKRVKQGLLQNLMTRGIGHTRFRKTEIGEIPESWSVQPLQELLESRTYGISSSLSSKPNGTPVLRMGNLKDGRLDLSDLKYADLSTFDPDQAIVRPGDILFNRTNSIDLVGRSAMVDTDCKLGYASYLIRLRAKPSVDPRWLVNFMNSWHGQRIIKRLAKRSVSQANINPTALAKSHFPVPPLEEQRRIADMLNAVRNGTDRAAASIAALASLKRGLMQNLLTGRVRVKPD